MTSIVIHVPMYLTGAFLVPYVTFLILGGLPLYYLELVLGQFSGLSALSVWEISPIFKGKAIHYKFMT